MTLDAPIAISNHDYSSTEFRRAIAGFAGIHENTLVSPRAGVLSGFAGTASGMSVTVGSGLAIVSPGSDENGAYMVANSGADSVSLEPRDATYTRWDTIYLRIYDDALDGLGRNEVALEVAQGAPSSSPVDPSIPGGSLPLWRAVVPPGTAPVTTVDLRPKTTGPGGVLPCTSSTRPTPSSLNAGLVIWETDTKRMLVWGGSNWDLVIPEATVAPYGHTTYGGASGQSVQGAAQRITGWASPTLRGNMTFTSDAFIVPKAGLYAIDANVTLATGTTYSSGQWASGRIYINNGERVGGIIAPYGAGYIGLPCTTTQYLEAGDAVSYHCATHNSAPARDVHTTGSLTHMSVTYLGE